MNKYQRFILKNGDIYLSTDLNFNVRWQIYDFVENDENFVINQDNNYNIKKHNILFKSNAIEFVEVDANLVPSVKADTDIAVINGNYALDAGLTAGDAISFRRIRR